MCIFLKLSAPLFVECRHLLVLCDLVRNHIFHFLVDRIVIFVRLIRHIPEISVKK